MRPLLAPENVAPAALNKMEELQKEVVAQVKDAVARHDVVVVGMAQNPHVRKVRRALEDAGIAFEYLEYGSYFSQWRPRLAIKLWSGWPTFPQVFVKGVLVGGEDLTKAAIADGTLRAKLGASAATPALPA
ncbi:MAG TPA: glutaredoxin domain-containing protein [Polyangiaceae bacterium]|jgi:glutaredoxin-related protein